jgi:hypothetical protein
MTVRYDLHTHSTHSDGRFDPDTLARMAREAGLSGLALTDHDTVSGLGPMAKACEREGLSLVNGIEISVDWEPGTLHMLGLFIDPDNRDFGEKLKVLQEGRRKRNPLMVARLAAAGIPITLEEVLAESAGGQLGRPHFAAVLIRKGFAKDTQDAFDRWLGKGRPGYVEKEKLSPEASIAMIRSAGGVAVLAHPIELEMNAQELENLVARLVRAGLGGIEAEHSSHREQESHAYRALASLHGLACSGGSDFHGIDGHLVALGTPSVTAEAVAMLREKSRAQRPR